jgi:hypothetical protein
VLREAGGRPPALFKMTMRSLLLIICFTLLSPGLSFGADSGVEGTVEYRGEIVTGAYVELFDIRKPDSEAVASTNTGSDGRFTVSLQPGSYRLTVKKRPEGPGSGGMLFGSTGKASLEVGRNLIKVPLIQLRDMGVGEGMAGEIPVSGSVHGPDGPLAGAYVYFYPDGTRRGPGYLGRARAGKDGRFKAGLTPGAYTVTVRFEAAGVSFDGSSIGSSGMGSDGMGTVSVGDLVGDYRSNPLQVGSAPMELGRIQLRSVDPDRWQQKQWANVQGGFKVTGQVMGEDRSPMAGAYVFLYDDRRMVGKPISISAPTGEDGRYNVAVSQPGEYYIGARTRFGGPIEPGEFMGAWDEKGPRPVILEEGVASADCDIVVREVW